VVLMDAEQEGEQEGGAGNQRLLSPASPALPLPPHVGTRLSPMPSPLGSPVRAGSLTPSPWGGSSVKPRAVSSLMPGASLADSAALRGDAKDAPSVHTQVQAGHLPGPLPATWLPPTAHLLTTS
jgi:hypothetical protein